MQMTVTLFLEGRVAIYSIIMNADLFNAIRSGVYETANDSGRDLKPPSPTSLQSQKLLYHVHSHHVHFTMCFT